MKLDEEDCERKRISTEESSRFEERPTTISKLAILPALIVDSGELEDDETVRMNVDDEGKVREGGDGRTVHTGEGNSNIYHN